ncbi:hypothetical protein [Pseudoalteromonas sp. BSi20652]|uniref:hypothetical protein n=1 Tax=Pseudoalteromonas sp. BSi20652 TaxID=388384 RepID=UPI0011118FA2|nr:hypothetical protein [Pseudoalteromonas sp. BSi20652]
MEDSKYELRKSKLYWMFGGDIFWYHFNMQFLKPFVIFQFLFSITINILQNFVGEFTINVIAAAYLLGTLIGIASIFKKQKVSNFVMRSASKPNDAKWVFIFISLLCVLMLVLLPFGHVKVG